MPRGGSSSTFDCLGGAGRSHPSASQHPAGAQFRSLGSAPVNSVVIVVANAMLFVVAAGAAVAWLLARRSTKLPFALTGVLALGLAGALATLAGALWDDPRPFVLDHVAPLIAHAADNGFPSDHATASAAIAAAVLFFNRRIGWVLAGLTVVLGMSRVMAGVHHWPDVLVGFALGALAAWLAHSVVQASVRFVAERRSDGSWVNVPY